MMSVANLQAPRPPVRIKVLMPFHIDGKLVGGKLVDGKLVATGETVTVDLHTAQDLVARGRAEWVA